MRRIAVRIFWCVWGFLLPVLSFGQDPHSLRVTPSKATMLIGQSQQFRVIDENGRMQRHVSWSISDRSMVESEMGDELTVRVKQAGSFRIDATTGGNSAHAEVKVVEGNSLPQGAARWSIDEPEGCKTGQITPAVPSSSGIDIYVQSTCPDGEYLSAVTAEGIQVWRRKISGDSGQTMPTPGARTPQAVAPSYPAKRRNLQAASVCDLIEIGTGREKVRDLLKSNNLPLTNESSNGLVWIVEQPGVECKLWFDEKSAVTKKRKTLTAE